MIKSSRARPIVLFISRDHEKFAIEAVELGEGIDNGEGAIRAFVEQQGRGEIDLRSVYPTYTNEQLSHASGIARALKLRGLT
jgi:hypothetical protein